MILTHPNAWYVDPGSQPNDTSAVCLPECKRGQCCVDGKCYCFDAVNNRMKECPGIQMIVHPHSVVIYE